MYIEHDVEILVLCLYCSLCNEVPIDHLLLNDLLDFDSSFRGHLFGKISMCLRSLQALVLSSSSCSRTRWYSE